MWQDRVDEALLACGKAFSGLIRKHRLSEKLCRSVCPHPLWAPANWGDKPRGDPLLQGGTF